MSTIEMTSNKIKQEKIKSAKKAKIKKERKKRDWVGIVHKICKVCIFRTLEAVAIFVFVSTISIVIGSSLLPMLSFTTADGSAITQSTDFYTACATWLIPMLFYTLLAVSGTLFIHRKFISWIHNKMTLVINAEEKTEKESVEK